MKGTSNTEQPTSNVECHSPSIAHFQFHRTEKRLCEPDLPIHLTFTPAGHPVASPLDLVVTGMLSVATERQTEDTVCLAVATETKNESTEMLGEDSEAVSETTGRNSETTEMVSEATERISERTELPFERTELVSEVTKMISEATEMISGAIPEGFYHSAQRCATQEALRWVTAPNIPNPERVVSATRIRDFDSTLSGSGKF